MAAAPSPEEQASYREEWEGVLQAIKEGRFLLRQVSRTAFADHPLVLSLHERVMMMIRARPHLSKVGLWSCPGPRPLLWLMKMPRHRRPQAEHRLLAPSQAYVTPHERLMRQLSATTLASLQPVGAPVHEARVWHPHDCQPTVARPASSPRPGSGGTDARDVCGATAPASPRVETRPSLAVLNVQDLLGDWDVEKQVSA